jgi:parvulin-like peptidyl-prolyl isomerase
MTDSSLFLTANDQHIYLGQALKYLENSGKLQPVLWEVMHQYVIEQELQARKELDISSDMLEQVVSDFRLEHQITDSKNFQAWLVNEGLDYDKLRHKIAFSLKLKRLKAQVTEPNLQEYFIERKLFLDRVVLSRLVVEDQALAEELKSQIVEDGARLEQLVQEYSVAKDRIVNGMMGPVSRGEMPDALRAATDLANVGELIGPLEIEEQWCLFRIEQLLPTALDEQLKQELKDELFEHWLVEKIRNIKVKIQV